MSDNTNKGMFFEELIFLDLAFHDANDFFDFIYPTLNEKNYVKNSFLTAIKKREEEYPTALPTKPYVVAMPHTDIEHIIKPFISVVRVLGGIPWHEMANNDQVLSAKFIFLLGFTEKDGHVNLLQTLIASFSEGTFLEKLHNAKTCKQFIELLNSKIKF